MAMHIRRREFIVTLGGAAAWLVAARAQQALPVIGFLHSSSPELNVPFIGGFRKGLSEAGFVEGQNVTIEFRWAAGQEDRLPELAADLVRRRVDLIVTPINSPAALAAKAATTTIPIVFAVGGDPVALGLVKSLNHPGGNLTGVSFQTVDVVSKQVGLLHEVAPQAKRFVALVDPHSPFIDTIVTAWQASAAALGLPIEFLRVGTIREIDAAFANLAQEAGGSALLISPSAFFTSRRIQLATLAARYAIPAIYGPREFAESGGLISYGPNFTNVYQQIGVYTGRVLKGEKPANLPVEQPTKFELVINLTTARAIGVTVPNTVLATADEVIE